MRQCIEDVLKSGQSVLIIDTVDSSCFLVWGKLVLMIFKAIKEALHKS